MVTTKGYLLGSMVGTSILGGIWLSKTMRQGLEGGIKRLRELPNCNDRDTLFHEHVGSPLMVHTATPWDRV